MEFGILIHKLQFSIYGRKYEIAVYLRADGLYVAKTTFSPSDIIIHDGYCLEEVLATHRQLLPLAIDSRLLCSELRCGNFETD